MSLCFRQELNTIKHFHFELVPALAQLRLMARKRHVDDVLAIAGRLAELLRELGATLRLSEAEAAIQSPAVRCLDAIPITRRGFEAEQIDDFKGLAKRSPLFAGVMAIFMFSLAGIPPTVGFYAKLAVLQSLVSTNDSLYIWLAVIAVVATPQGRHHVVRLEPGASGWAETARSKAAVLPDAPADLRALGLADSLAVDPHSVERTSTAVATMPIAPEKPVVG